jgi:hypothetical protein
MKQTPLRPGLGKFRSSPLTPKGFRPLVEIVSTFGPVWTRICPDPTKQRWPGPSRASAGIFSLFWIYLSTPLISLNSVLRRVPRLVKTVTSATAINEAISAYSIAVAPDSLPTNALRDLIIFCSCSKSGHPYGPLLSAVWNGDRLPALPFPRS